MSARVFQKIRPGVYIRHVNTSSSGSIFPPRPLNLPKWGQGAGHFDEQSRSWRGPEKKDNPRCLPIMGNR